MPSLNRNDKIMCENCGIEATRINLDRYKKRCSVRLLCCPNCLNFLNKPRIDRNFRFAKKQSVPKPDVTFKWKLCYELFPGFYALRQHKNSQHCFQIKTANVVPDDFINEVDDAGVKEELRSCEYSLVDSELQKPRHKVFNFAIDNFNAKVVDEKLDFFFSKMKCAEKVSIAFGFILKEIEDVRYRYMYAHENNTLLDRSKPDWFKEDVTTLKNLSSKMMTSSSRV